MTMRRSQRVKGVVLPDDFDELAFSTRRTVLLDARAAREAPHADVKARLTFFDILPELRLRIYKYAMETDQPRNLEGLKAPTLAAVSKQVRAEALPVFFSECTFTITIRSNLASTSALDYLAAHHILLSVPDAPNRYRATILRLRSDRVQAGHWRAGRPKAWLARLQKREGVTPAFRNVVIHAYCPGTRWIDPPDAEADLWLRVPVASKSKPVVTFENGGTDGFKLLALEVLRKKIEVAAVRVASQKERFVGFAFDDLQGLADAFVYWPEIED